MSESTRWVWRRWQLVKVEDVAGEVVLDAIELSPDPVHEPGSLITLAFTRDASTSDGLDDLAPKLERWSRSEDGVCDAFYEATPALRRLAMLQGNDLLIVAAAPHS
jgi:hypothetical protein